MPFPVGMHLATSVACRHSPFVPAPPRLSRAGRTRRRLAGERVAVTCCVPTGRQFRASGSHVLLLGSVRHYLPSKERTTNPAAPLGFGDLERACEAAGYRSGPVLALATRCGALSRRPHVVRRLLADTFQRERIRVSGTWRLPCRLIPLNTLLYLLMESVGCLGDSRFHLYQPVEVPQIEPGGGAHQAVDPEAPRPAASRTEKC